MRRLALVALLLVGLVVPLTTTADGPPQLVILRWHDRTQLAEWAAQGWDIWEVGDGWARAALTPRQRLTAGPTVVAVEEVPADYAIYPACYRTVEQMAEELESWALSAPGLVELLSAGPSWETTRGAAAHELWTARLTNRAIPGPKPKFFLVGNHHARELITPEVVLRFGRWLLDHYGQDGDATWILDTTEVWLMPSANPDGHVMAEQNFDWRKNTNDSNGSCSVYASPNSVGIDLNRNYSYRWGGASTSSNPCSLLYKGPAPFSEPEAQAVRDLVSAQRFDLLISLHSYGDMILYPWGYSTVQAPDESALKTLAARMARWNSYRYGQPGELLYNAAGDTTDWAYGTYGILSYTFEIGTYAEGAFWPQCAEADAQWEENLPALIYAARAAQSPRLAPYGPAVEELTGPATVFRPEPATISATLRDDRGDGSRSVISATLALTDATPLAPFGPVDGAWGGSTEVVSTTVSLSTLATGPQLLVARAEDAEGSVGVPSALLVTVVDGRLHLTVRDAFGRAPIAGAAVRLVSGESVQEATTDGGGQAVVDGPSGTADVEVIATGYHPLTTTVTLAADQITEETLELPRLRTDLYFPVLLKLAWD